MSLIVKDNISLSRLNRNVLSASVVNLNRMSPDVAATSGVPSTNVSDLYDVYCNVSPFAANTVVLPDPTLSPVGKLLHFKLSATAAANQVSVSPNITSMLGVDTNVLFAPSVAIGSSVSLLNNGTKWVAVRRRVPV